MDSFSSHSSMGSGSPQMSAEDFKDQLKNQLAQAYAQEFLEGEDLGGMLILCCHWVVKEFAASKLDGLTFCVLMIFHAPLSKACSLRILVEVLGRIFEVIYSRITLVAGTCNRIFWTWWHHKVDFSGTFLRSICQCFLEFLFEKWDSMSCTLQWLHWHLCAIVDINCNSISMQTVRDKCFAKCITKPGSSLSGSESSCISRCVERYIEATGIISKALFNAPR
ncbi:hypothetical protein POTOM_006901 [Populus tomentosa]|uniref:Tim10-like domain-containing protein n=1 Tax=Populus tomentosa TaxID=118781 RepID=A0A8X8APQ3_POPTO|nr:hypothetical protein POTOM_006901 [Populus tomentosa]